MNIDSARQSFAPSNLEQASSLRPVSEDIEECLRSIEHHCDHPDELQGLATGFSDLDIQTGGLEKSQLIVVASRPSMGKSVLCQNIAQRVAVTDKLSVAWFSPEGSRQSRVQRLILAMAEIHVNKLRCGSLEKDDFLRLKLAAEKLRVSPLYIDDNSIPTVSSIHARCLELQPELKELALVIIDDVRCLVSESETYSGDDVLDETYRQLKLLAVELSTPVIAVSQVSRSVESRRNKRPLLCDLQGSREVANIADLILFLYRDEYYNPESKYRGEAEIIVAKNRTGPTGTIELLFNGSTGVFRNKRWDSLETEQSG